MEMTRYQYILLAILVDEKADNPLSAMTLKEIQEYDENFTCKRNTVYKILQEMLDWKWVKKGLQASKADTYFITGEGKKAKEKTT